MIFQTAILFLLWLLLSESLNPVHLVVGFLAALGVAWVNRNPNPSGTRVSLVRAVAYLPWLLWQVLRSGLALTRLILHPRLPIAPTTLEVRSGLKDDAAVVLLGNSITLTPGTITVEVNGRDLLVHGIDEASIEEVKGGEMERRIAGIFGDGGSTS